MGIMFAPLAVDLVGPPTISEFPIAVLHADDARTVPVLVEGSIPEGSRNTYLSEKAYALRKDGLDVAAIESVLLALNDACVPPLEAAEVKMIAQGKRNVAPEPGRWDDPADDFSVLPEENPVTGAICYVDFTRLAHSPPPERRWVADEWLPRSTVIALFGPGGVGKSVLMQQCAVAVANGNAWLGLPTARGPVLGFFCEDDESELQRRAVRIFQASGLDPSTASTGLHLDARAGKPNALITFGTNRIGRPTALMHKLEEQCAEHRPVMLILDNIAQLFTGLENDRGQVTDFCNVLTGLARSFECAVVILGHPAKAAESQYSGSTAWENAVRTRLFLERQDDGTLVFRKAKANYSALGEIALEYLNGVFVPVVRGSGDPHAVEDAKAIVLAAVAKLTARQQPASHLNTTRNYLVKLMAQEDLLDAVPEKVAAKALSALIDAGELVPNSELPWKTASRHMAHGLVVKRPGNG